MSIPLLGAGHLFLLSFFLHFNMSIWDEATGSLGGRERKKKKKEKKPEQIQSCAEGNLENNLATITTRLWGGIKRNERDTLLSAAVHNWTKQFLSETDVVTWESARARTRWSNQQNAYQAISSPFCRTLLHNLIYFFPSVYKSLPELLWILISRRRLDACPLRLGPL